MHWFECLMNNLNKTEKEKSEFILALINNPIGILEKDIRKHLPIYLGNILCSLKKYALFRLGNKKFFIAKKVEKFSIESYIENQIINNHEFILNDYHERIKEDLVKNNLTSWEKLSHQEKTNLCTFYAFSEFVSYILLGIIESSDRKKYYIDEKYLNSYKIIWFSRYFTQQSHVSDSIYRGKISCLVNFRYSDLFQSFVDNVLDKYISFHPKYIKFLNPKDNNIFSDMRRLTELLSFLSLQHTDTNAVKIYNDQMIINRNSLYAFGFSEKEISSFFKYMDDLKLHENDRMATELNNNLIRVNDINLKFAMQTVLYEYLTCMKKRGYWFEKEYILKYLKDRLDSNRFIVTDGINDPEEKYDVDMIIYDRSSSLIYFCQIKHRITTLHPFFRDEFNEYCRNDSLNHGVRQLCSLRSKILTKKVRQRLISRLGKKIIDKLGIERNCRFILLHSIENLDMCTKNGISMYEWNTFRNLLQGGISLFVNKDFNHIFYNNSIDFSNIMDVQDYLISELQKHYDNNSTISNLGPVELWEILKNAKVSFGFNTSIYCMGKSFFKLRWKNWDIPLII